MHNQPTLDYPLEKFRDLLYQSADLIIDRYQGLDHANTFAGITPSQIQQWLDEPLPNKAMDPRELLMLVKEKVMDTATLNIGPNMYAYVMAGGTQISVLAELIKAAINQNVGKWHLAPVMSELERKVIQWGAQFIGYDDNAAGVLVSGGSAANLSGLTVARNVFFEKEKIREHGLFGLQPFVVYASTAVHSCIDKSVDALGIGMDHLRKIPTLKDHTIDVNALTATIGKDLADGYKPFCLIGTAGTVNTGAIDPLDRLADIADQYGMWFHIDAAYGGLAAALEELKSRYQGMDRGDSIAIDFHKWMYQPFEAGCIMVKSWENLNKAYYKKASYLASDTREDCRMDFNEHHFQLSRSAKALKIWMSFKAYGSDHLKEMMRKDIALTQYLACQLEESADFEICGQPELGIVCFRYLGDKCSETDFRSIDEINSMIIPALERDGRVFITGTMLEDRPVIRACLINHRLQEHNIDFLIEVIRETGNKLLINEREDFHTIGS